MKLKSVYYQVLLVSTFLAQAIASPLTVNNTTNPTDPTVLSLFDDRPSGYDKFIAMAWDRVLSACADRDPEPWLITMDKDRNPYGILARIQFTLTSPMSYHPDDGSISFRNNAWGHPLIFKRQPYAIVPPTFNWNSKPMTVEQAVDLIRAQPRLTPIQRELNWDHLEVRLPGQGVRSTHPEHLSYRFERKGVYVFWVDMLTRRVVEGNVNVKGEQEPCLSTNRTCLETIA